MNLNKIRRSVIARVACAAIVLSAGYATATSVNAAAPDSNPLASPIVPGCFAKELLEVKSNPSAGSPTVGVIYKDTPVNLVGRSGAWTNLWAYSPGPYGWYVYVNGWTKGKVSCR